MPVVLRRVFSACRLWAILTYSCFVLIAVVPRPSRLAEAQTAASPPCHGHADAASQSSADGAAPAELLRQLADDELSPKQIAEAAARALRLQADEKTPWDPRWGDFVEMAHKRGTLPTDAWGKYVLGAVRLDVKIAKETKRADGLAVSCAFKFPTRVLAFRGYPRPARGRRIGHQAQSLPRPVGARPCAKW